LGPPAFGGRYALGLAGLLGPSPASWLGLALRATPPHR